MAGEWNLVSLTLNEIRRTFNTVLSKPVGGCVMAALLVLYERLVMKELELFLWLYAKLMSMFRFGYLTVAC